MRQTRCDTAGICVGSRLVVKLDESQKLDLFISVLRSKPASAATIRAAERLWFNLQETLLTHENDGKRPVKDFTFFPFHFYEV